MSIYVNHSNTNKNVLVIYEDTRGKTRYKLCRNTSDKELTYNGFGYYIITIQKYFEAGYYTDYSIYNLLIPKLKNKKDYLTIIINKLLELFN